MKNQRMGHRSCGVPLAKKIAIEAARLGDSKKAENIAIYELGKNSSLADYAVLMSADSVPQLEAVEEAVNKAFKAQGLFALHKEGGRSHAWKVLDYGGALVHIFETGIREFYSMDQLYASYARIPWRKATGRGKGAKAQKGRPDDSARGHRPPKADRGRGTKGQIAKAGQVRVKAAQKPKAGTTEKPENKVAAMKKTKAKPAAKKKTGAAARKKIKPAKKAV